MILVTVLMGVPGAQNRPRKGACEQIRGTQLRAVVDAPSSACVALDCVEGICSLKGGQGQGREAVGMIFSVLL